MKLEYVGAMPQVSGKGIAFDKTRPDKYAYLNAAVELLEALDYGETEETQHLYNLHPRDYDGEELLGLLEKHCENFDEAIAERDAKAEAFENELIERVKTNGTISEDEREAWLKNIAMMEAYYRQYATNEAAYEYALRAIADEIHRGRILRLTVPLTRNYGSVIHDLQYVLEHHKPPITMQTQVREEKGNIVLEAAFRH